MLCLQLLPVRDLPPWKLTRDWRRQLGSIWTRSSGTDGLMYPAWNLVQAVLWPSWSWVTVAWNIYLFPSFLPEDMLGGQMIKALDCGPRGNIFISRSGYIQPYPYHNSAVILLIFESHFALIFFTLRLSWIAQPRSQAIPAASFDHLQSAITAGEFEHFPNLTSLHMTTLTRPSPNVLSTLQAIKNWQWEWPGNEARLACVKHYTVIAEE